MTPRTPQVGDTITTAEELDALPSQAVFLADGHVWTWLGAEVRNPMRSPTGGAWTYPGDALRAYGTFTVLYLPGHPPRPERDVKAEALREAATDFVDWDVMYGHDLPTPETDASHDAAEWLMRKADRIERGEV